jgi:hypothetical protein
MLTALLSVFSYRHRHAMGRSSNLERRVSDAAPHLPRVFDDAPSGVIGSHHNSNRLSAGEVRSKSGADPQP